MAGNPLSSRTVLVAYAGILGLAIVAIISVVQGAGSPILVATTFVAILFVLGGQVLVRHEALARSRELAGEVGFREALLKAADSAGQASGIVADGRLIDVNESACDLLGYPREHLLALGDYTALVAPDDREAFVNALRSSTSQGTPVTLRIGVLPRDGGPAVAEVSATPFNVDGSSRVLLMGHLVDGVDSRHDGRREELPPVVPTLTDGPVRPLSPREQQVLELVARGYSNQDIAEALEISLKTVEVHTVNIRKKLPIHNRVQMVRYALQHGLVRLNEDQPPVRRRPR